MNEMLYGNTGRRDEGINIDMEQSLYQKMQARTFVPKLKSLLNDKLQGGDKFFIFIGNVEDKAGSFSVLGYNAKLENDSRGGDYSHYIATPLGEKKAEVSFGEAKFLTEEGFVEYVSEKNLNDEKKFSLTPVAVDIDINAKKKIVNNLMETFMRVKKRKCVSFSLDESSIDAFSAKSVYVLLDLAKYLPYQMRKHISFISSVNSTQKLPDMLNLAAYVAGSSAEPNDAVRVDAPNEEFTEGLFAAYVNKVFAMSDSEREDYFEKLYTEIEKPTMEAGLEARSDVYFLDTDTRVLWESGDAEAAVANICSSVDDILKVYPCFLELGKLRLLKESETAGEYLKQQIVSTGKVEAFKPVYEKIEALYTVCRFEFGSVLQSMSKHSSKFLKSAATREDFIKVADGLNAINPALLDKEIALLCMYEIIRKSDDLTGLYDTYLAFREKNYVDAQLLDEKAYDGIVYFMQKVSSEFDNSKLKLQHLERVFENFKTTTTAADYAMVQEVFDRFAKELFNGAFTENVKSGRGMLLDIDKSLTTAELEDIARFVEKLADIKFDSERELKSDTSSCYRRITGRMYSLLNLRKLSYKEIRNLIKGLKTPVYLLEKQDVHDGRAMLLGSQMAVPDGMYRFVFLLDGLMEKFNKCQSLSDVAFCYNDALRSIDSTEEKLRDAFNRLAPVILENHLKIHSDWCSARNVEKTLKKLDGSISPSVGVTLRKVVDNMPQKGKNSALKFIIIGAVALVLVIALAVGGILLFGKKDSDGGKNGENSADTEVTSYQFTQETVVEIEDYLKSFDADGMEGAFVVVGKLQKNEGSTDYTVLVDNDCGNAEAGEKLDGVVFEIGSNKKAYYKEENLVPGETVYVLVLQKAADKTCLRGVFGWPQSVDGYDFTSVYSDTVIDNSAEKEFNTKMIQYAANKADLLKIADDTEDDDKGIDTKQSIENNGEKENNEKK